mmetsp:Transcript_3284/g.6569  ORF Transcript_3284/g.6569 Transcript_3284/m.6569 type:complete len:255 (-) Transcript_3284:286-1050(-)
MHRDRDILDALDVSPQVLDQRLKLGRCGVAYRVRHVERSRPSLDSNRVDLSEKRPVTAERILRAELDIIHKRLGVRHHLLSDLKHLLPGLLQLVFHVNVTGSNEGVNARKRRRLDRLGAPRNVALGGTREPADDGGVLHVPDHLRDLVHSQEVIVGRDGEARLDDVHAELGELLGHLHLLLARHGAPRALLSIAQRRIKDLDTCRVPACGNVVCGGLDVDCLGPVRHPQRGVGLGEGGTAGGEGRADEGPRRAS